MYFAPKYNAMADTSTPTNPGQHRCYVISGISGGGKTTVGSELGKLPGVCFIDGDRFFLLRKPQIALRDGTMVTNWDSENSINWNDLNGEVSAALANSDVVLATFLPIAQRFEFPVTKHLRISIGDSEPIEIDRCIKARKRSKGFTDPKRAARDILMVKDVVYPMHMRMVCEQAADHVVEAYKRDGDRRPVEEVVEEIRLLCKL
jgi:hypothetical protein